jgi:MSHA pilin protein MshA
MEKFIHNQKGFTLIEIIAVLVILGVLAVVMIPKYLDMGRGAMIKASGAAVVELNAREKIKLMEWKLNDGKGFYPSPGGTGVTCGPANPTCSSALVKTIEPVNTILGTDWNSGAAITSGVGFVHQGRNVTFTRTAQPSENEPASWVVTVS